MELEVGNRVGREKPVWGVMEREGCEQMTDGGGGHTLV